MKYRRSLRQAFSTLHVCLYARGNSRRSRRLSLLPVANKQICLSLGIQHPFLPWRRDRARGNNHRPLRVVVRSRRSDKGNLRCTLVLPLSSPISIPFSPHPLYFLSISLFLFHILLFLPNNSIVSFSFSSAFFLSLSLCFSCRLCFFTIIFSIIYRVLFLYLFCFNLFRINGIAKVSCSISIANFLKKLTLLRSSCSAAFETVLVAEWEVALDYKFYTIQFRNVRDLIRYD